MIKVTVKETEDINRALKRFKKKFDKAQVLKQYKKLMISLLLDLE